MKWNMTDLTYATGDDVSDYDIQEDYEAYTLEKGRLGYRIVYPEPNQLLIDIDCDAQFEIFKAQVDLLRRVFPTARWEWKPSDSGLPNRHIIVTLPFEVLEYQRIAFQAAMGSDPARELVNLIRMEFGIDTPTRFCEKPGGGARYRPGYTEKR